MIWHFFKIVKHRVTIWPSHSTFRYMHKRFENIYQWENLHINVHRSIIYNMQKCKQSKCTFFEEWINKNVLYPYNKLLFVILKEESVDTFYILDEPWKQLAKWKVWFHFFEIRRRHKWPHTVRFHLCDMGRIDKSIET